MHLNRIRLWPNSAPQGAMSGFLSSDDEDASCDESNGLFEEAHPGFLPKDDGDVPVLASVKFLSKR